MRKRYDKEFKAKVTLEALKGEKTLQELTITYSVHPNMIVLWGKQVPRWKIRNRMRRPEVYLIFHLFLS